MTKVKKPRKKSQKQLLIEALLTPDGRINWGMEMRLIGKLLETIADANFWLWFGERHKYASLMHLMSDMKTTNIITKAHFDYTKQTKLDLKTPEAVKLETEKVGEDIIVPQKPKTLFDFVNT